MRTRVSSFLGKLSVATAGMILGASSAAADEGQWTPDQISQLDFELMKSRGLELTAAQLWDPTGDERTGGLMRAAVNLSGCTASFISPRGLIATNHHCAYSAIQANSTVEHDYLRDGYLATATADELRATGKSIRVLRSVQDVTEKIDAARSSAASGDYKSADAMYVAITDAVDAASRELVRACEEKSAGLRCNVASFYNGSFFRLFEYVELKDVRLVYAPPASIGEYGGEIDNWMWPRHTG
ncbi:MAG: S46 family peptidase, partial [Nannocystaceae bacterium]